MVGAPFLVAKASMKVGAGLATIASEPEVIDKLEKRVEELMTLAFSSKSSQAVSEIKKFIKDRKVSVLAIGPGLKPESASLVRGLIKDLDLPIVADGGALSALQDHPELLKQSGSCALILTPHSGEFERLIGKQLPQEQKKLKPIAKDFAKSNSVILVLKGEPTYVAHPDGSVYINSNGGPELATAGTGDVLSGMIAGILAQGIEPGKATEAAVYLHGLAGNLAAKDKTVLAVIAPDVIDYIPKALKRLGD